MVPVERIELPTFGLQNRCSTAELNRRIDAIGGRTRLPPHCSDLRRLEYQTCPQRARTSRTAYDRSRTKKAALLAAFSTSIRLALLAEMHAAVLAAERCRGYRQSRCGGRIPRRRAGRWRSPPPCRPRRRRRRLRHRPARSCRYRPSGCSCRARRVYPDRPAIAIGLPLIAAGVGISRSLVLAIGVWIELRAIAGIVDHLLRHGGAGERDARIAAAARILDLVMGFSIE